MFVWLRFIMPCSKHNFWYLDMLEMIPLFISYIERFHVAMKNDNKMLFEGMYIYMYIYIYKHTCICIDLRLRVAFSNPKTHPEQSVGFLLKLHKGFL